MLIAPQTSPDHSLASNWRSSAGLDGSPGTTDAVGFSGDPDLDLDGDGLSAFLEHALGTIDGEPGSSPGELLQLGMISLDGGAGTTGDYLTLTYRRNLAADDVIYEVQSATDLGTWSALGTILVSSSHNGDGTEMVTHRSTDHDREYRPRIHPAAGGESPVGTPQIRRLIFTGRPVGYP